VEADMGIYQDSGKVEYLNRVAERLVAVHSDKNFSYQFAVVDQYEPNAFALPGGYVYVSRGLLTLTNTEDELANVLAHEIIHVSRRHSARRSAKATVPILFALPGAIVGGVVNEELGMLLMAPAAVFGGAYLASHSRQDEFESDKLGQQMAAEAGYDPSTLAAILARLEAFAEEDSGRKRIPGFFDTHPSTPDRVARVLRDAEEIEWQRQGGVSESQADYLGRLDGLLVGENPAMGVISGREFLHPELDFSLRFPEEWDVINTREAVFAAAPEKDGTVALGIDGKGTDPKESAEKFQEAFSRKYRMQPSESRSVKIGDLPAYRLTYTDTGRGEPVHMQFLWVAYRGLLYRFIGLAPERYSPLLKDTVLSFQPLTPDERASIRETRLRVVPAESGESLARLSARTGNEWTVELTAVVNGLDPNSGLTAGQRVKIAVSQPYGKEGS
jgi:predicted Zn-dependent protease